MHDNPARFGSWIRTGLNRTVVHVEGELDLAAGGEMAAALDCAVDLGARTIVIDLSRVTFIDAHGIGLITRARQSATQRGVRLGVSGVDGQVAYLFTLVGLSDLVLTAADSDNPAGDVDGRR